MIVPCKDCEKRCPVPNCHMTCEEYLDYVKEKEKLKEQEKLNINWYDEKKARKHYKNKRYFKRGM